MVQIAQSKDDLVAKTRILRAFFITSKHCLYEGKSTYQEKRLVNNDNK